MGMKFIHEDDNLSLIAKINTTENQLFHLYFENITHSCFFNEIKGKGMVMIFLLWTRLKILHKKNTVTGFPWITNPFQVCELRIYC